MTDNIASNASIDWQHWGFRHASRNDFAVRDLTLHIRAGERVLLLGASGIGKSTILQGVAGLLGDGADGSVIVDESADAEATEAAEVAEAAAGAGAASEAYEHVDEPTQQVIDDDGGVHEGSVLIDGMTSMQARGRVGLVLQDPDAQAVFQRLGDNIAFGPENLGMPRDEIWQQVHGALDAVGLHDLQLHRSVQHLSGGQMQRVALAGALAMQPDVLLLDEPTANLDPDGVEQIVGAVQHVLDTSHSTMVLVEHRTDLWIDMIDRVIVLGKEIVHEPPVSARNKHANDAFGVQLTGVGRIWERTIVVADGTPDDVFANRDLDLRALGIWVPQRYQRAQDVVTRIHTPNEPDYEPSVGTGEPILRTRDLAIGRNGQAIAQHIDMDVRIGQITALVGANGAGKSTLSLTLAGLLAAVDGDVIASDVLADGTKSASANPMQWTSRELASRISYVFQNPEHQFACSSVLDEVMLAPLRTGMSEKHAREIAEQLLERFHLAQYAAVNPYTLSGGEQRRLTVASALAAAPRVLILDEPTFGQDRNTWTQIAQLMYELRADNVSIIVVTHDCELVTALGARVVELVPAQTSDQWVSSSADSAHSKSEDRALLGEAIEISENDGDLQHGTSADATEIFEIDDISDQAIRSDSTNVNAERNVAATQAQTIAVSAMQTRTEDPRQSSRSRVLASINPVFRLFGAFIVSLPLLLSLDVVSAGVALALEFIVCACIGLTPWRVIKSTWPVFIGAPTSALAVLLYGKTGGDIWWQWAWIVVSERSAMLALATALRILAIGIPAIIAVLGIDATDLADGMCELLHLPDRFVYSGLAGMRLFAVLRDDWAALTMSRRSRGLGDDHKIRTALSQSFALLVLSIRRSTTLASAMQARGFGSDEPRTHARISTVHARDWVFLVVCVAIPVLALVAAAVTGTFSFGFAG